MATLTVGPNSIRRLTWIGSDARRRLLSELTAHHTLVLREALRAEFGGTPSALKTVSQLTRSNERAVRNWFDGKNGPSGENPVILMRHSDHVLRTILGLADRHDLVAAVGLENLWRQLIDAVAAIHGLPRSAG